MKDRVLDESVLFSIVVPIYNEEDVLEKLFERIDDMMRNVKLACEVLLVNDGSRDDSARIIKEKVDENERYKLVDLSRNFGHQQAVSAGLSLVKGDVVGVIDADLQDPPELFINMLDMWTAGADVVYGKRRNRDGETFFKKSTAYIFYRLLNWAASAEIPNDTGDFRLMDKNVVRALNSMPEHHRFLRGMVAWLGFTQEAIEYDRDARAAGTTKYPFKKMISLSLDAMFSFSMKPLRLMGIIGLGMTILGFVAAITLIILRIMYPEEFVPGIASTLVALLTLFGFNFLCLGILGEYLGRTYVNVQGRPLFVIKDVHGVSAKVSNDLKQD